MKIFDYMSYNDAQPWARIPLVIWIASVLLLSARFAPIRAEQNPTPHAQLKPDVIYVPTPSVIVDVMLEMAQVAPKDVVYDLGCGDGRIVIEAAKRYGARGVGIDIVPQRIQESEWNARRAGVANRVEFRLEDFFDADISEASVVMLYLLPTVNMEMRPRLWKELAVGTRIVSHAYDMGDWVPDRVEKVIGTSVYLWTVTEETKKRLAAFLTPQRPGGKPPPDVALMQTFATKVYQNLHGFWEAELSPGITLVYVPDGEFMMGSKIHKDERPHRVYLDAFWIGKSEVTQDLWRKLMDRNPSASQSDGAHLPVENVNWNETQDFIRTLRAETGIDYRLPSEAEWEKACRGGEKGGGGRLEHVAWFDNNANGHSHPVMQKRPNGYGLHDMLGNVWEWCEDWADNDYYDHSPNRNPTGPIHGTRRITRGGGFRHAGDYLRCAHRNHLVPDERRPHLGFRLAISADLP